MTTLSLSRQTCTDLAASTTREWLVTDGCGGFAMGTVAGLATRRYHGLLVVATAAPIGRRLGLAALDATLVIGDRRVQLSSHEWASRVLSPAGFEHLDRFELIDGVPRWRFVVGSVIVECELAMTHGSPAVGVQWRVVSTGAQDRVTIEMEALCTWRDAHGERFASGSPKVTATSDGFVFEDAYRVGGPGFSSSGEWYLGVHHREEATRGLQANEDLWSAGRFSATLAAGETTSVQAWAGDLSAPPPSAGRIVAAARERARSVAAQAGATDAVDAVLAHAADQFIVTTVAGAPTVVAGYPWFGDWSRDTMTSYEGLFLETGRLDEGRKLLLAAAGSVSEGMLANTADAGGTEYNTVDASMWFIHAVKRHILRAGDQDLGAAVFGALAAIVDHHVVGTRFGIKVATDGLITQGADGWALTWMDARVDGRPITPRMGKPVEVNALWIEGLGTVADIARSIGQDASQFETLASAALISFTRFRSASGEGLADVLDGPDGVDATCRPNQLIAAALPDILSDDDVRAVLNAVDPLVTAVGLRSLAPSDPRYLGHHRGSSAERDAAYHQGTIWPWLIGPLADAHARLGTASPDLIVGLEGHLNDFGVGSVSETLDGAAPHAATGCPFQAWSVAELLRAKRTVHRGR